MEKVVSGGVKDGLVYPLYPAEAPLSSPLKNPAPIVPPTMKINHSADENPLFLTLSVFDIVLSLAGCAAACSPVRFYEYSLFFRKYSCKAPTTQNLIISSAADKTMR